MAFDYKTGVFRLLLTLTIVISLFLGVAVGLVERAPLSGFITMFLPVFVAGLALSLLVRWVMSWL